MSSFSIKPAVVPEVHNTGGASWRLVEAAAALASRESIRREAPPAARSATKRPNSLSGQCQSSTS